MKINEHLVAGLNPSEKYESQLGLLFPICGTIKNDPNHQLALKSHQKNHGLPQWRYFILWDKT